MHFTEDSAHQWFLLQLIYLLPPLLSSFYLKKNPTSPSSSSSLLISLLTEKGQLSLFQLCSLIFSPIFFFLFSLKMMSERGRFPFTTTQWQELEHQALIFKYMISGMPIPPDLLITIKRSMDLSLSPRLFPHQPQQYGWSCLQMGMGRKIDPEPGRCRRTDGKKWRCSKEAYPDSKYCERHMHRGKNRSRKPVETISSTNKNNTTPISSITRNLSSSMITNSNFNSSSTTTAANHVNDHPCYNNNSHNLQHHHPFYYPPNLSSAARPPGHGFSLSSQDNTTSLLFDSGCASSFAQTESDFRDRYASGLKEEVDEHSFFSEASGTMRSFSGSSMDDSWQLTPLTMNTSPLNQSKQRNCSSLQNGYSSYLQLQNLSDTSKKHKQQQNQHSYILGSEMSMKMEREDEPQKTTVHRFFDEWPPKNNRDSWLNLDDNTSNCSSGSTTQLSISIPNSSHVFPIFNSRTHNDG